MLHVRDSGMDGRMGGASPFACLHIPDTEKEECGNNALTNFLVALYHCALINYVNIIKIK